MTPFYPFYTTLTLDDVFQVPQLRKRTCCAIVVKSRLVSLFIFVSARAPGSFQDGGARGPSRGHGRSGSAFDVVEAGMYGSSLEDPDGACLGGGTDE
jgi:hypothetical protein